ncbi:hypothetical protein SAMN05216431_11811 [Ligilactobacillus sp. WC1T17]|uniref:Zinc finger Sec23/Sec24-type domain-containing protein n=2 Tax=Ligilactobacillus TaxID=2767887 RepID=A0ABY1AEJ3_9LACO|nr:hypothetical protein SAMN05216431_11811 [Ligilactobacillus ruminis]
MISNFCPHCKASLVMQNGFNKKAPYYICKKCQQMIINPQNKQLKQSKIVWLCDRCNALLNVQAGFDEHQLKFTCQKCGYENSLGLEQIFLTKEAADKARQEKYTCPKCQDLLTKQTAFNPQLSAYTCEKCQTKLVKRLGKFEQQ